MDRHRFELLQVERDVENRVLLLRGEAACEIGFELFDQQRHAFLAPAPMPDRIFDHDFAGAAAIGEFDRDGVGDRALLRIEIVFRERLVFDAHHLGAQRVDAGIGGNAVLVVAGQQPAVDQRDRDHVLNAMVAVGGFGQRTLLVDDAKRRFVRANRDLRNVGQPVFDQRMQLHRAFDGGLRMKLRRE